MDIETLHTTVYFFSCPIYPVNNGPSLTTHPLQMPWVNMENLSTVLPEKRYTWYPGHFPSSHLKITSNALCVNQASCLVEDVSIVVTLTLGAWQMGKKVGVIRYNVVQLLTTAWLELFWKPLDSWLDLPKKILEGKNFLMFVWVGKLAIPKGKWQT